MRALSPVTPQWGEGDPALMDKRRFAASERRPSMPEGTIMALALLAAILLIARLTK